jgi:hypothetical protein
MTAPAEPTGTAVPETRLVGRVVAAPEVLCAVHGDRTILLDLRTERYLGLDEVGTAVWSLVVQAGTDGVPVPAVVDMLSVEFDAPRTVLERDVGALLDRLRREGLVEGLALGASAPAPRIPSVSRCALALLTAVLALRALGLRRSLAMARWLSRREPAVAMPTAGYLAGVVRTVDTAAAFFPGRALCLEQSLALYAVLRWAGVGVSLVLGAQPYPFSAHAWVEYQGEPVGESRDRVGRFVPFEGLGV